MVLCWKWFKEDGNRNALAAAENKKYINNYYGYLSCVHSRTILLLFQERTFPFEGCSIVLAFAIYYLKKNKFRFYKFIQLPSLIKEESESLSGIGLKTPAPPSTPTATS